MKKTFLCILLLSACALFGGESAKWISADDFTADAFNTWIAFRKDAELAETPASAKLKIAADSKYWLWVNGKLAVFEGGLKRGPNPADGYYDEIDIAPFLKSGKNRVAVLLWYFGKDGFSHKSSGKSGLYIDGGEIADFDTSADWLSRVHPAYGTAGAPFPNFRLSESNLQFDANRDMENWQTRDDLSEKFAFKKSREYGKLGCAPWNAAEKRPIPQWKLRKPIELQFTAKKSWLGGTAVAKLPYNMQMTPIITVYDPVGNSLVSVETDHAFTGGDNCLRAEYITKKGLQTYESVGWLNGHEIVLKFPRYVDVKKIEARESGYDAEVSGKFSCDNPFFMRFWQKGLNTLYVNMRDTYFDCPDRERAQWWGDVVILSGESFYTYTPSVNALTRKAIRQLVSWQRPDGALFAPIPGNYTSELPGQMLASIGKYGFWNYYMNTGDADTVKFAYPAVKKYLSLWTLDSTGLTEFRKGGWSWGDWGENRDKRLILAGWHYIALDAAANMAELLGLPDDAKTYRQTMQKVKAGFEKCWNGTAYRHPEYNGETDDRVHALAVISGIADKSKYDAIFKVFKTQKHASPYMEKYVMEALFKMGHGGYALDRAEERFKKMVDDPRYTTLFEGWEKDGFGGGSVNHAWSGGAITVISSELCGLRPLEPAWKKFAVEPQPANFKRASLDFQTVSGEVKSSFVRDGSAFIMDVSVPTLAVVSLPEFCSGKTLRVNGKTVSEKTVNGKRTFELPKGDYSIIVK